LSAEWIATYRLQLHVGFPLSAAQEILPYLAELGISHVYLSPCLQAVPDSRHGYDVADPTRISTDLGGEDAWTRFVACARSLGLGILLDIVPNHMSASKFNPWWDDLLAYGPFSRFADFFDIRIPHEEPFLLHLCSLARPYGEALETGELLLHVENGMPCVRHHEQSWPLAPETWGALLFPATPSPAADRCFHEMQRLRRISHLGETDQAGYRLHAEHARRILARAHETGVLERAIALVQGNKTRLDALLQSQFYRLHHWKLAGELANYRRFFDIDSLIGIRAELPDVFRASHARIERMVTDGDIEGVRVDHPDGLRDPLAYFQRLRGLLPEGRIYVEKILDNDERLNEEWPIDGTVGYDFMAKVNRLWMDDQRIDVLTATYSDFTGHSVNFARLVREKKRAVVDSAFLLSHQQLTAEALRIARDDWRWRDLSPRHLGAALAAVAVALPIYRTYRTAQSVHDADRRILSEALQSARIASTDIGGTAFDFLGSLFMKSPLNDAEAEFIGKWQQLTPAIMAKGVEDTTFYCFDRLVSGNEVGSQASLVGISADRFHEYCHYLSDRWPNCMLATSTHDNKRSEDVRARISILSEIPDRWSEALHLWSQLNADAWQNRLPDRHAEYLLYQTLVGAWPIDRERSWQYMLKACREAKINTSWHEPNHSYEEKIRGFVGGVFETPEFIDSLQRFIEPLILPARINSLSQTLIKMVAPGVPDFYQGTELWDLSLVDPDNRRPVDFGLRSELMRSARRFTTAQKLTDWDSGLPKLWMIDRILSIRRQRGGDFSAQSRYQPLVAQGSHLARLLAFRRGDNIIAVVPRFTLTLAGEWGDTRLPLPSGVWRNCFTDEHVQREALPAELFRSFPVALLLRDST
jgi:(1->4)-alpha-D-glucan 1-alpha-D-glucosylmutase